MLSVVIAVYTVILFYAFYFWGLGIGISFLILGVIIIALTPVFQKIQANNAAYIIKNNSKKNFINVNKAPWQILAQLPFIKQVEAKRVVYIRNHYGKYLSIEDFLTKMNIPDEHKDEISQYICI